VGAVDELQNHAPLLPFTVSRNAEGNVAEIPRRTRFAIPLLRGFHAVLHRLRIQPAGCEH